MSGRYKLKLYKKKKKFINDIVIEFYFFQKFYKYREYKKKM